MLPHSTIDFRAALIASASALGLMLSPAQAQTATGWKGTTSDDFQTASNWDNGFTSNANLFVGQAWQNAGRTGSTTLNNATAYSGYRITFENISNGANQTFTVQGSTITLFDFGGNNPRIENNSSVNQLVNAPINFGSGTAGEINAVGGDLTFGGTLGASGTNGIKFSGSGHIINLNGVVDVGTKYLAYTGTSGNTINLNNSATAGNFYVMNGATLNLNNGGNLNNTSIRLGGDFGTTGNQNLALGGTLNLTSSTGGQTVTSTINTVSGNTSGALVINSQNTSATNTISGNIFLDSNLAVNATSAGGTLNLSGGTIDLKAQTMTVGGAGTVRISGQLQNSTGSGQLVYSGAGTLLLNGANTYTGTTNINSGTLGGTGQVTGAVNINAGATVNAGENGAAGTAAAVGTINVGALTFSSTSTSIFDVAAPTSFDRLVSSGAVLLGGNLVVNVAGDQSFLAGQVLQLVTGTSLSGTYAGIVNNGVYTFGGYQFVAQYTPTEFDLVAVPEPATWFAGFLTLSLAGFSLHRKFLTA